VEVQLPGRIAGWAVLALAGIAALAGGLGLGMAYLPEQAAVVAAEQAAFALLDVAGTRMGREDLPEQVLTALAGFPLRFVLAPLGALVLVAKLLPGRRAAESEESEESFEVEGPDARMLKRSRKDAAAIAKKGDPLEAAELCFAVGLMDEAADYFMQAGEYVRVAEIRHDQNRFMESAELYGKAGSHDSAAVIYAQQGEYVRAGDAQVQAGNLSVAAEMYEQGNKHRLAAECYDKSEFPRQAAKAYIKCEEWTLAAKRLEDVMVEEAVAASGGDDARRAEYHKVVRMCGHLYERSGDLPKAEEIFVKAGLFVFAGDIALKQEALERAAELFIRGRDVERAAKVLRGMGKEQDAARILADHHRDAGRAAEAAEHFAKAGELLEAGDLYRSVERYEDAANCYLRFEDFAQAAEMFVQSNDRARAAECFERAGRFSDAAECYALGGDDLREAEMLDKAGEHLRSGQIHRGAGREDEAIAAFQQVASDHPDALAATAALGEIFRERGKYSLAIAKLEEALEGREVDRDTVRPWYTLATVRESDGALEQAVALYEKVLAFDYNYEDAEQHLARCREALGAREEAENAASSASLSQTSDGRYAIQSTLGRGGMGIVYKAQDTVLDRTVAFKVLPEALNENPQALKNFLREAKSAAQLNHPNIVTVYDAGVQDGAFYIAMEYVDGNTLKDIVRKRGPIGARGIVHVLAQMAEALSYAHEKKIVHRDIKNANTMWTRDRKAKIMDFGLARVIEEVRNHTTVVSGTPYYMSPEQTLGKNVDHRTDIYSLGVSVFEMATGTLPFTEGNLPYHHVHTSPPDPRDLKPDVPDLLAQIILRCLCKDPGERYQSTREILAELRSGLGG
jgi:tetratricopeptide (TPR) repeat protein